MANQTGHFEKAARPATEEKSKDWRGVIIGCVIICILGAAFRYPLLTQGGYASDLEYFTDWANAIHKDGLANVYQNGTTTTPANYPVGFMYIFYTLNKFAFFFSHTPDVDYALEKPFKILLCFGDLAITVFLVLGGYWLGGTPRSALLAGACYILNPAIIMVTGIWGQTNAIAIGFIIAALILLHCRRWRPAAYALAAIGFNMKIQVAPFLALLPLATIFLNPQWSRTRHIKEIALGGIIFLATTLILLIPFILKGTAGQAISAGYLSHIAYDPALSRDAWNPWYVCIFPYQHIYNVSPLFAYIGRKVPWLAGVMSFLTYWHISILLFGIVTMLIYFYFLKRPSKGNLFFAASAIALAFFVLMTKIHERYLLDAIPLLLLAAIFDRRAFGLCGVVSLITAINVDWSAALTASICAAILGILLVRMIIAIITPEAVVAWPWEVAFRRRRWLDSSTALYAAAVVVLLGFWCPWNMWLYDITKPDTLYVDELPLLHYAAKEYCPVRFYGGQDNNVLVVEGTRAKHGFAVVAGTIARFPIPKGYSRFNAKVGISDQVPNGPEPNVIFGIKLDERPAYSTHFVNPNTPCRNVSVLLKESRTIDLIVFDANTEGPRPETGNYGYAVWMDARIEK